MKAGLKNRKDRCLCERSMLPLTKARPVTVRCARCFLWVHYPLEGGRAAAFLLPPPEGPGVIQECRTEPNDELERRNELIRSVQGKRYRGIHEVAR